MCRSEPHTPVASIRTTASSGSSSSGSGRSSTLTTPGAWKVTARMTGASLPCDRTSFVDGAVQPIARNLRRWRMTRELTLSALAAQAGVAKSTVSLIERGQGNPSIDTVWALASALGVPFASLFHDESPADDVSLVREHDSPVIAVEQAGLEGDGLIIRHLLTRTGGALIEIYSLVLEHGAVRHADAHVTGLFEHITVAAGSVEIS